MKFENKYLPIIVGGIFALGIFVGSYSSTTSSKSFLSNNNTKEKLNKLIDFIDNEYVDDVNTDSIVSLTVDNILAKLDPHSVYIPPKEQAQIAETMKGDFVGIGISFYMFRDSLAVINPVKNGPSAKAGIKAGDRILFADKTKLFGRKLPNDSLFTRLKGEVGSPIVLTVYRKSEKKNIKFTLKRDVIPLKSVDVALRLNATTGYIKINRFAGTTFTEFKTALASLKKQGIKNLVVDVRDNGGGYMEEAIAIADEFLKDKTLIVFTKSAKEKTEKTYATEKGNFEYGKVFVLINENSASASEILAGAIQDNDRGTIIGRRSFGKGLVQLVLYTENYLKRTVSKW
jgi:carboxyl-terminal processing protease